MEAVDKSQVPPLHQKRILAFVNFFLTSSCGFLNDFATTCETKFIELERKMQKVEAALTIIEAKLASIPDVSPSEPLKPAEQNPIKEIPLEETATASATPTPSKSEPIDPPSNPVESTAEAEPQPAGVRACDDERYKRFFKMLQFGVPAQAVKLKMNAEGADPQILDTPNVILADGVASSS